MEGLRTWTTTPAGVDLSWICYTNGHRYVTNTAPDGSYAISDYQNGWLLSVTRKDSSNNQLGATTNGYDAHGRIGTVQDARTGTTTYGFDNADRVTSVTTPAPASGQSAEVTTTYFNNMGWVTNVVLPDNGSVSSIYLVTGELATNSGARTYPAAYTYDYAGRLKTLTTWTNFAAAGGAAATTWTYDAYRGFLTNKTYADGSGPGYAYTAAGRLARRAWARGVTTTNSYSAAGDLSGVTYSDSTPAVSLSYDRRGRPSSVTQGSLTTSLTMNDLGQLLGESYSGGDLAGLAVTNIYDSLFRRTNNATLLNGASLGGVSFTYATASRLDTVSDGTNAATYAYLANSPLVGTVTFKQSGTTRLTTTKSYDNLNRLTQISSVPSADSTVSFNYAYNSANQRTSVTNADSSRWLYQYDTLGQVTLGKRYWSDGTIVAGQQFEYGFDDIGNRKSAASGGDQWGANLRYAYYSANNLNQYTSRTAPGSFDVIGTATNSSTVTVNNVGTSRKGDYYRGELPVDNSATPLYLSVTNVGVVNNGPSGLDIVTNKTGNFFVPQTPESFKYDADGNLTNDGRWSLVWDAENRLITMTANANVPTAALKKLDFGYDYRARRITKKISTWTGSNYVAQSTNKFVYDDWNLVAEMNNTNSVIRSYSWGLDLSGIIAGAGGVGGITAVNIATNGAHFTAFDGNGNVRGLVSATNGAISAQYEYGPFGEALRTEGPAANSNPCRFSTKFNDDESDFLYFGYRYYNTSSGRWPNRDPIAERVGMNLYGFVSNKPIGFVDPFGDTLYPSDFIGPLLPTDWRQTIFNGFADPRYQQHDQAIHDWVNDFNANKDAYCGCTARQRGGVPDATFDQVKSWLIQESGGNAPRSRAAWNTDPAQVNVPGDWSDWKSDLGLTKPTRRNEGTFDGNLSAALGWLCRKGFWASARPVRANPERFFDGWFDAFRRYNGRTVVGGNGQPYSVNYANQIINRAANPGVYYPIQLP